MIQKFIKKNNTKHLNLFFTGWGTDEQIVEDIATNDDLAVYYDYSSLELDAAAISSYSTIRVVGWSMGVWAASFFISKGIIKPDYSVALNGTMFPVDDERGINRSIFHATYSNLSPASLNKFQRRMCLDKEVLLGLSKLEQRRSIEQLRHELITIEEKAGATKPGNVIWDMAIIGKQDLIFTTANQVNGWNGFAKELIMKDIPHYHHKTIAELLTDKSDR